VKPLPTLPHDLQVPPGENKPGQRRTDLQVVRLTITSWLPAISQPKAFTAVAFPSSGSSVPWSPSANEHSPDPVEDRLAVAAGALQG